MNDLCWIQHKKYHDYYIYCLHGPCHDYCIYCLYGPCHWSQHQFNWLPEGYHCSCTLCNVVMGVIKLYNSIFNFCKKTSYYVRHLGSLQRGSRTAITTQPLEKPTTAFLCVFMCVFILYLINFVHCVSNMIRNYLDFNNLILWSYPQ